MNHTCLAGVNRVWLHCCHQQFLFDDATAEKIRTTRDPFVFLDCPEAGHPVSLPRVRSGQTQQTTLMISSLAVLLPIINDDRMQYMRYLRQDLEAQWTGLKSI